MPHRVRNALASLGSLALAMAAYKAGPAIGLSVHEPDRPAAPLTVDAGVVDAVARDASVDAQPPELYEVDDAKPLVFRDTLVGIAVNPVRETSILRRAGDRASLRLIVEREPFPLSRKRLRDEPHLWQLDSLETFVGTVRRDGGSLVFELHTATGKTIVLTCRAGRIAVHPAGMTERADPRSHECNRPGLLRPVTTQPVDVLSCNGGDGSASGVYRLATLATWNAPFAPVPGVEQIDFANDCDAAGGYRFISGGE